MASGFTIDDDENEKSKESDMFNKLKGFVDTLHDFGINMAKFGYKDDSATSDLRLSFSLLLISDKTNALSRILVRDDWAESEYDDLCEKAADFVDSINEWFDRHNYDENGKK